MSRLDDMTTALFGNERVEVTASAASSETYTITGHATSSSAEGTVWVNLSDDVTHGDNEPEDDSELGTSVEMSTTVNVLEGDEVIVTVYGGVISSMVVTGVVGRGDEQDDKINDAQRAAQAAWDWADESHDAAVQAQRDADAAEAAAGAAQQSADSAAADAASASASASQAIADAASATQAATAAQGSADSAAQAAQAAQQTADAAQRSANAAQGSADAAQASANAANAHAVAALNSLSTVEDVVDTLTWITEHGTMARTADTAVDPSKVYFVRDNDGDYSVGGNRYSIVQEPVASDLSSYYELTIDKSVENYIATHLSVTNEGLWLTPTESGGYRVLVATGGAGKTYPTAGTYIIDGSGTTVAQFTGTGISFADDRTFYIGDSDAYIFFDGNGHINIGGSNVTIGGSTTLAELLAKYDATITSDDISVSKTGGTATITVGGDTVTISDGATGAQGPKGDTGDQGPQGPKGSDGTSVTVSRVEYGTSASASTQPSSWSTSVPTSIAKGQWLWVKTSYSDGTDATTKSYVGTDGEDGTSVFVQSATKSGDTTTVVIADSEGHTDTLTIKDGTDGTNGTNGQNGLTGYVHTAWSNSADGSTDFSTTVSANKKYLGVYTDNTEADSTSYSKYSWSLIKGADGTSVTVSKVEYGTSASASTQPSSWSETVPTSVTKGRWLWVRTTYSDSTTAITKSYVGTDGTDGKSVYVQSSSKSGDTTTVVLTDGTTSTTLTIKDGEDGQNGTAGASGYVHTAWANSADGRTDFSTTVSVGKSYLGVYTDNTAADSQTYSDYSWSLIKGAKGDQGETGPQGPAGHSPAITTTKNSDGSVTIYVDGTATSTVDAGEDGQTPTVTTTKNSDGSVTIYVNGTASNTVEAGADGTSYYTYVRYSANASGSGMVTTPTSATKYIGVYTGTSSSVPAYTSFKWSKFMGDDADPLTVTSHEVDYQLSTSGTTAPTGDWSTTPLAPTTTQYLWTRTTLKFSDNTTSVSYSVGGKAGTNGQNGTNGTNGTDGGRWYAGTKITGTSTTATVFSGSGIAAAVVGDMYLNTSTYNTYRCTVAGAASVAKWVYTANIKGQTGAQGPQGETGPQGPQGPQGETGSAGTNGVSITGVEHQYYLSTSSTSQTGGSWTVKPAAFVRGRYYWERWKVSFSSGDPTYTTATLAEEVTSAWTAIESNEDAIALKANSADVYTKTAVDGKITQEVTDRNSAITAKANEITSTVSQTYTTKQEFADLEVGGRNLLQDSDQVLTNGSVLDTKTVFAFYLWSTPSDGYSGYKQMASPINISSVGRFVYTFNAQNDSQNYWCIKHNGSAHDYPIWFKNSVDVKTGDELTLSFDVVGYNPSISNGLDIRNFKLERGNKATDWTIAPEDIDERITTAESAITQNATNINAKVSKNDVINQINLSTEGVLIDADRVEINGTAVFNAISSDVDSAITSKGYATTSQVSTAKSEAISSANSATDTKLQSYLTTAQANDLYDAKGAAASLVSGGDNLIGRFNLNVTYNCYYDYTTGTMTSTTTTNTADSGVYLQLYKGSSYVRMPTNGFGTADVGKVCGWTLEKASDFDVIKIKFNGNKADSEVRWNVSSIPDGTTITLSFYLDSVSSDGKGNGGVLRGINLRTGNMLSEWSLAPQDETIGGRNLLAGTDVWVTTFNSYSTCGKGSETIPAGSVVTVSVEVNADNLVWDTTSNTHRIGFETSLTKTGGGSQYFGAWAGNAISESWNVVEVFTGSIHKRISKTFTLLGDFEVGRSGYVYTQGVAQGTVKVGRAKIEYGNRATDWSPSEGDIVKRTQRIYYRWNSATAPAAPTSWVTKGDDGSALWTKMHVSITESYKYIYTCEQHEMADGTLGHTDVLLDNTITVIDGGNIITGSVTANKLNASDINASKTLTVGAMTDAAAATILNSNVQVGGRNLLRWTASPAANQTTVSTSTSPSETNGWYMWNAANMTLARNGTGDGVRFAHDSSTTGQRGIVIPLAHDNAVVGGEEYTLSFTYKTNLTALGTIYLLGPNGNVAYGSSVPITASESDWARFSAQLTWPSTSGKVMRYLLIPYRNAASCWMEIQDGTLKLEKGNKATDWSQAPEDVDAAVSDAAKTATNYITQVDQNGITIHPSGGTSNRAEIDADGMEVYKGNVSVASYGDTARIGKQAGPRVVVETDKLSMYAGSDGGTLAAKIEAIDANDEIIGAIYADTFIVNDGPQLHPDGLYMPQNCKAIIPSMTFGLLGYQHDIAGINFGFSSATTNSNGITTFNPNLGVKPTAVFVAACKASNETEAVAKIAVPMVWSIDSSTQVQVRWKRSDTNAWLTNNAVGWYWLALA